MTQQLNLIRGTFLELIHNLSHINTKKEIFPQNKTLHFRELSQKKKKMKRSKLPDTFVNVGSNGKISGYVGYALKVLGEKNSEEKTATSTSSVTIRGAGNALGKALSVAEIIKRKSTKPLHQTTTLESVELPSRPKKIKPTEEKEEEMEEETTPTPSNRKVPLITIVLSTELPPPTTTK